MSRIGGYAAREPGSLKEAQQQLVTSVGGLDAAVDLSRLGRSQLARCTSQNEDDQFTHMPIDVMLRLEEAAKANGLPPAVMNYLAHQMGFMLVPVDDGDVADNIHRHLAEIGTESSALFSDAHSALEDGVVSPHEAGRMKRGAVRLASALSRFTSRLDGILHRGRVGK